MSLAQIIEALQINNLPHLPNGDFIITEKQQQSILALLSQQAVVESDVVFSRIEVMNLLTDFGIQVYKNKDYNWDMPNDAGEFLTDYMRSPDYKQYKSTQFQSLISNLSYLTNLQKELLLKDLNPNK